MKQKNFFLKSSIVLSLMASVALHATNGDTLIGVGVKTRGMGGAGIAYSQGAESALVNPALITEVQSDEISFGATVFMPTIETDLMGSGKVKSDADLSLIPEVSLAHSFGNGYYIGTGMWGTAGMGVDFKGTPQLMKMRTQLQLMQFAVPMAYKISGLSIAVAPIVQYGSLDISFDGTGIGIPKTGDGVSDDFGFGASIGMTYDMGNGLKLGAVYKSQVKMEYKGQISQAVMNTMGVVVDDHLDQPAEYGVGIAYTSGHHTIAVDYKRIAWSDAAGYDFFGWEDQDVFAVGYEYAEANWAFRLGYNHATSPVGELDMTVPGNTFKNVFNLLGFPATAEDHYTIGGSYQFSDTLTLDLAVVYATKSSNTFNAGSPYQISNDHSEVSASFQLTYKF